MYTYMYIIFGILKLGLPVPASLNARMTSARHPASAFYLLIFIAFMYSLVSVWVRMCPCAPVCTRMNPPRCGLQGSN